ncbi:MAG: coenzyme F420-0:L-glutamate ligase [Gammaproteobacteria bacterium]|nr:MAG: coenzyme F420-0:L-glutamate ligase [Gammaproteobacteria bacterium]
MAVDQLQLLALKNFPLVSPGDNLINLIIQNLGEQHMMLEPGDVLVVAQKVVSKAEDRYVALNEIEPSEQARQLAVEVDKDPRLVEVILRESNSVVRHCPGVLIVEHKLGYVMANAGIDASNIEHEASDTVERVLLLPESPDDFAEQLRGRIVRLFGVNIAVVINDSVGRAWRNGTVGMALGAAGLPALRDRRGEKDLFGRTLEVTEVALADELASAASIIQGEGDEGIPVVLLRGLDIASMGKDTFNNGATLLRPKDKDLFR